MYRLLDRWNIHLGSKIHIHNSKVCNATKKKKIKWIVELPDTQLCVLWQRENVGVYSEANSWFSTATYQLCHTYLCGSKVHDYIQYLKKSYHWSFNNLSKSSKCSLFWRPETYICEDAHFSSSNYYTSHYSARVRWFGFRILSDRLAQCGLDFNRFWTWYITWNLKRCIHARIFFLVIWILAHELEQPTFQLRSHRYLQIL